MDIENKSTLQLGWGGARKNSGGKREGAGRKKLPPEKKAKPISKVVYVRLENELYNKLESMAKNDNLIISKYLKNMIVDKINSKE